LLEADQHLKSSNSTFPATSGWLYELIWMSLLKTSGLPKYWLSTGNSFQSTGGHPEMGNGMIMVQRVLCQWALFLLVAFHLILSQEYQLKH
jgi:hypothetical protein